MFGEDYRPDPYIVADYERARKHRWYMSARMICVNDLYPAYFTDFLLRTPICSR